ncbi:MAG: terpene cyclase/mutase family protein, partial [Chloroflexi bacterium]|nr:terpene cyclase/mutase family protein [Chloroflexota bacterium]
AQRAWQALSRRTKPDGGWGYNGQTPADADSITWGLRLAQALHVSASERACRAQEALRRHLGEDGGIVTYAEVEPIRDFAAYPNQLHYGGWTDSHVCVTAAAAGLQDADIPCLTFLRQRQMPVGGWQGYWWEDDEYTTGLAAEALAQSGDVRDRDRVEKAVAWVRQRVNPAGAVISLAYGENSPFATAWAVRLLLLDDAAPYTRESLRRAVRWLLAQQSPNGSWIASARLRVPPPDVLQPQARARGMTVVLDQNRLFTTATVLETLIKFRQSMERLAEIDTTASA